MKTLVICQGALGDLILTLPCLWAIGQTHETPDLWCREDYAQLATDTGLARDVRSSELGVLRLMHTTPEHRAVKEALAGYDQVVLFSFSRELAAHFLCHVNRVATILPRPPASKQVHTARYLLDELHKTGTITRKAKEASVSAVCRLFAAWTKDRNGLPDTILIHPGAGSRRKMWPLERFVAVGKKLQKQGKNVCFLVGPAETAQISRLRSLGVSDELTVQCVSIGELGNVLSRSQVFLGNDSGVSHLAGVMGLGVVAIFGPTDPVRWQPMGQHVQVIRPRTECSPCFETQSGNCCDPVCLENTKEANVLDAVTKLSDRLIWEHE